MQSEFIQYAQKHLGMNTHYLEKYSQANVARFFELQNFTPSVVEERPMNMVQIDVFSRLMKDRIIFLGVPVDDYVANVIQAQLLFLESADAKRNINLYINSPGGSVTAGLGIYDTMQLVKPEIHTTCTGMAASMSAVLLSSGHKGKRACLPHSRVMIHQTSGGMQGQFSDMQITYNLFQELQDQLFTILSKTTGQSMEQINKDCDRDKWMKAPEAKAYGLVDEVLGG